MNPTEAYSRQTYHQITWSLIVKYIINSQVVADAISKVNAHKNDRNLDLSSGNFLHGGTDLNAHIAFLLTSIVILLLLLLLLFHGW